MYQRREQGDIKQNQTFVLLPWERNQRIQLNIFSVKCDLKLLVHLLFMSVMKMPLSDGTV